jgi:hypothetical protein
MGLYEKLVRAREYIMAGGVNESTLTGTATLVDATFKHFNNLDPGGATRTVLLPSERAGRWVIIRNAADAAEDLTVKEDSGTTTQATISRGGVCAFVSTGSAWVVFSLASAYTDTISEASAGVGVTIDGLLLKDGCVEAVVSATAAEQAINSDLSINHATAEGRSVDAAAIQLTTARSSGIMAAFAGTTTSLAGDSGGTYAAYYAVAPTDGGGSATHVAIKVGAGHDAAMDLSAAATGEGDTILGDNLASAWELREAANSYLKAVTTNDAERLVAGKVVAFAAPTVVDMADAALTLIYGTAGAAQAKVTSNILLVDPNSGGASEILTLPPVATSTGVELMIINTGGEGIVIKDVAANTIITLDTAQHGKVVCDGTNWYGFMGGIT